MTVVGVVLLIAIVVGGLLGLASAICIGFEPFRHLTRNEVRRRLRDVGPYAMALVVVYAFSRSVHRLTDRTEEAIGVDITNALYAAEGAFVAELQRLVPAAIVDYLAFVYVFGFAFLLVFPPVAYFVLPSQRHLKELLVAYSVNYGGGSLCYLAFVAYGPRNVLPDLVREPLYDGYPQVQSVSAAVSSNTNVFPSLHTSLAVTVLLLAWHTRGAYPRWLSIAAVLVVSVLLSTMVLGIHWASDVIAGIVLAVVSVGAGRYLVGHWDEEAVPIDEG